MKVVLLLALIVALVGTSSGATHVWKELFTMDCSGTFHIFDSSIPLAFNVPVLNNTLNSGVKYVREAVNCKCPIGTDLSEKEYERRFVPGMTAAINIFNAAGPKIEDTTTCPLSKFKRTLNSVDFMKINLPTTCTLERWEAGEPCLIQYALPTHFDAKLQFAAAKCGSSVLPYVSITCSGTGCDYYLKPCKSNADCGGKFGCHNLYTTTTSQFLSDFYDVLKDMYVYDSIDTAPGCFPVRSIIDKITKLWLSYYGVTNGESVDNFAVCGLDINNTDDIDDDFNTCKVTETENPDSCGIIGTHFSVNCATIQTWDGVLSDGTSAVADTRKAGTAFKKFDFPQGARGTSSTVSIASGTCSGTYNFLPTEKYGVSVGFDARKILAAWIDLLKTTQDCRYTTPLSLKNFRLAWGMWTLDFWGYLFSTNNEDKPASRSSFLDVFDKSSNLILPETCTLANWITKGECAVKWGGLKDLLNIDVTIRGRIRRCSDSELPEFYIDCEGTDCVNLFRPKVCTSSSQCGSNLICKNLLAESSLTYENYNPLGLLLWGESKDAFAACPNKGLDKISPTETCSTSLDSYYKMLREVAGDIIGVRNDAATSGFGICTFDYDATADKGEQWAENMVINDGPDYKLKGMDVWRDAFSVPDPSNPTTGGSGSNSGNSGNSGNTGDNSGALVTGTTSAASNLLSSIPVVAAIVFVVTLVL